MDAPSASLSTVSSVVPRVAKQVYQLRECECLQSGGVAPSAPVIQRVKIIGWASKNRRQYLPESVECSLYEGLRVNIDHPAAPNESRRLRDRFGRLVNVTKEADGAYGDLQYNPAHPLAEQVKWWAANDPAALGLSHNAVGQGHTKAGIFIVEKVMSVRSVDLVADPATTQGLYEAMDPAIEPAAGTEDTDASVDERIGHLILAILGDEQLDLKAKRKKILKALKLMDDGDTESEETEEEEEEDGKKKPADDDEDEEGGMEESVQEVASKNPAVKQLLERLDRLEAERALAAKTAQAKKLCADAKLPDVLYTEVFESILLGAKDDKEMKKLIEDRKAIASVKNPRSTGPVPGKGTGNGMDVKTFAQKLKGGK